MSEDKKDATGRRNVGEIWRIRVSVKEPWNERDRSTRHRDRIKRRHQDHDRYTKLRRSEKVTQNWQPKIARARNSDKSRSHKETADRNKHKLSDKVASGNKRKREAVELEISGVTSPSQNGNGEVSFRETGKGLGRNGGIYIPPFKLARLLKDEQDKSSVEYQRMTWDALRKIINGLVNKVNASNIKNIIPELFAENIIRGRGLFVGLV